MAGATATARRRHLVVALRAGSVAFALTACVACGARDEGRGGAGAAGCQEEGRLTVPGPSDLTASMTRLAAGQQPLERLLVRPDGAVRLERRGREPACYSVPEPLMADVSEGVTGLARLERSYGPRPTPPGRVERLVSSGGYSVRSVDGSPRPRRLSRAVTALERVARAAP